MSIVFMLLNGYIILELKPEDILQIYNDNPWASEVTAQRLKGISENRYDFFLKELNKILKSHGIEELKDELETLEDTLNNSATKAYQRTVKTAEKLVNNINRDADPIQATAELMAMTAEVTGGALKGIGKLTKNVPKIGGITEKLTGMLGGTGQFLAGFSTALTALATEQEKMARLYISYGMQVSDLTELTEFRGDLAGIAMSMAEFQPILDTNKAMFARVGQNSMKGASTFVNLASKVEAEQGDVGDFGYNTQQLAIRLAEESQLLFGIGELESLNIAQQKKILENFSSSSAMTTFLADKTGEQRSSLLRARQEAASDIDFRQSIIMNGVYIAETLGQESKENIIENQRTIAQLFGAFIPQISESVNQTFNNGIRDIRYNTTVMDNVPTELAEKLAMLSPQAQAQFYELMDSSMTGEISGAELIKVFQTFAKSISESDQLQVNTNSPVAESVNQLINQTNTLPESFMNLSEENIKNGIKSVKIQVENIDDVNDSLDSVRKGFRKAMHTISPGFDTIRMGVDAFAGTVNFVGNIFDSIGIGYENPAEVIKEIEDEKREAIDKISRKQDNVKKQIQQTKDRLLDPGMFDSPVMLQRKIDHLEKKLERMDKEKNALVSTKITSADQSVGQIVSKHRREMLAEEALARKDTNDKSVDTSNNKKTNTQDNTSSKPVQANNVPKVTVLGQTFYSAEEIDNSNLKSSLKRKAKKRLEMKIKKSTLQKSSNTNPEVKIIDDTGQKNSSSVVSGTFSGGSLISQNLPKNDEKLNELVDEHNKLKLKLSEENEKGSGFFGIGGTDDEVVEDLENQLQIAINKISNHLEYMNTRETADGQ